LASSLVFVGVAVRWLRSTDAKKKNDAAPLQHAFLEPGLLEFGERASTVCVIDFECTCDEPNTYAHEIIEFPVVLLDAATGELGASFRVFVRPTEHPVLSTFCTKLTGVRQQDVDAAPTLAEALVLVDDWLRAQGVTRDFAFAADSPFDFRRFLHPECERKKVVLPSYYYRWIDVSKHLLRFYPNTKCPLAEKLKRVGLDFHGRAHCGLDDATNIARLAQLLLRKRRGDTNPLKTGKDKAAALAVNDGFSNHRLLVLGVETRRRGDDDTKDDAAWVEDCVNVGKKKALLFSSSSSKTKRTKPPAGAPVLPPSSSSGVPGGAAGSGSKPQQHRRRRPR